MSRDTARVIEKRVRWACYLALAALAMRTTSPGEAAAAERLSDDRASGPPPHVGS